MATSLPCRIGGRCGREGVRSRRITAHSSILQDADSGIAHDIVGDGIVVAAANGGVETATCIQVDGGLSAVGYRVCMNRVTVRANVDAVENSSSDDFIVIHRLSVAQPGSIRRQSDAELSVTHSI